MYGSKDKSIRMKATARINLAAGTHHINVLQLTGTVRVLEQVATIMDATTLTNCTDVHADLYDGTNTVALTLATGCTLSGAPVGTFFTKDKVASEIYSVSLADECRMNEVRSDRFAGQPFTITQKNGADTYIRFAFTTTDDPVDFTLEIVFVYEPVDGGVLSFV